MLRCRQIWNRFDWWWITNTPRLTDWGGIIIIERGNRCQRAHFNIAATLLRCRRSHALPGRKRVAARCACIHWAERSQWCSGIALKLFKQCTVVNYLVSFISYTSLPMQTRIKRRIRLTVRRTRQISSCNGVGCWWTTEGAYHRPRRTHLAWRTMFSFYPLWIATPTCKSLLDYIFQYSVLQQQILPEISSLTLGSVPPSSGPLRITAFHIAAASMLTSSTSVFCKFVIIPQIYWSISNESRCSSIL